MNNIIETKWNEDILAVGHFCITKDENCTYFIYKYNESFHRPVGDIITSDISLNRAIRRAEMLEIGYRMGYSEAREDCW